MTGRYVRRVYTLAAIAEEIGKSVTYVEDLVRQNKLPAKRVGRTPVILAEDFEAYLEALPDA